MSDFGMFESDEAAQAKPQVQARLAARKMDAAIDTVRAKFGRFLLGATGIDEFGDRWHYSKHDIRAAVEPYVFPNTGTMRRLQNAMKADWKLAHPYKVALSHDEAGYGQMATDNTRRNQDLDETYHPSSGNLVPKGDFEGWKNSVDQGGPEKVESHAFTPGGDSGRSARRRQAGEGNMFSPGPGQSDALGLGMSMSGQESTPAFNPGPMAPGLASGPQPVGGLGWDGPGTGGVVDMNSEPAAGSISPEPGLPTYQSRSARRRQAGEHEIDNGGSDMVNPYTGLSGGPHNVNPGQHDGDPTTRSWEPLQPLGSRKIADVEAARLVADIYTDFARSNGMRVASLDTLDRYASTGIHDADYRLLHTLIVRQAAEDCDEACDDEDTESEAPSESESDESDSGEDEGEDYNFGGESASEGDDESDEDGDGDHDDDDHHTEDGDDEDYDFGGDDGGEQGGGQQYTVPEQAPQLSPEMMSEIPQGDTDGSAPVPPNVIDSLLGLPEGTIEQLLLEEVEQGQGGGDPGMSGAPMPQGGGDDFFGGGGGDNTEPPRVARRRRQASSIADLARHYKMQPHELQAYADMNHHDQNAPLHPEDEEFLHDLLSKSNNGVYEGRRRQAGGNPFASPGHGDAPYDAWNDKVINPFDSTASGAEYGRQKEHNRQKDQDRYYMSPANEETGSKWGKEPNPFAGGPGEKPRNPFEARRLRVAKDYGRKCSECKSNNTDYSSGTNDYDCYDCGATFKPYSNSKKSPEKESRLRQARQFWAADGDQEPAEDSAGGGDPAGGEQPPQGDPAQGGGDPAAMGMGQPMMPPPGSQAVTPPQPPAPLENQPAEDALLDTANQAIMQMIDQETAEYQQIIDPLSQALQAIQFAQQVEQTEHPMDVTPPQGTVDVSPAAAPGGAGNPMQQQAMRRWAGEHNAPPGAGEDNVHGEFTDWPGSIYQDRIWNMMGEHGIEPDGRNYRHHQDRHGYEASRRRQAKAEFGIRNAAALIASRYRLSATGHQMLLNAALGRRGYEHVVEALKLVPAEVRKAAALHMSHLFAAGNQRFNRDVFMKTVMASNPRDRAGDAWRDGRDRGIAEHGRHDMDESAYEDPSHPFHRDWLDGQDPPPGTPWPRMSNRNVSRGRLPFDRPRLAGETWVPTAVLDAFEHYNSGTPRVDDGNDTNDLPTMPGANPNGKNAASQKAVDRFQRWQKSQQQKGLATTQGEAGVHNFLQTRNPVKKRVGPDAQNMIHEHLGLQPDAVKAPKAKPVKAVNPTLKGKGGKTPAAPEAKSPAPKAAPKTASFFTRRVPGWRWDDHLSGYLSKEARAFTCSCGQKIASPSYKTCNCGKVWNVYAIGDSHHLASDTAEVYIAREIPVRPGVIMANKKMANAGVPDIHDHIHEMGDDGLPTWLTDPYEREHAAAWLDLGKHEKFADMLADRAYNKHQDISLVDGHDPNESNTWYARSCQADDYLKAVQQHLGGGHTAAKTAKDGGCTCWEGYERVPGTEPCASGSCRKKTGARAQQSHAELVAMIDKLADWTKYDSPDPTRDPKVKPPSTKIKSQPGDWTNRDFTGPTKGQWREPDPTELPRKTRKKK